MSGKKIWLCIFIGFLCSKLFFHSSILACSFISVGLGCIGEKMDERVQVETKKYIILAVCLFLGLILIILGKFFSHDEVLFGGAIVFASTGSVLILNLIFKMFYVLKDKIKSAYDKK